MKAEYVKKMIDCYLENGESAVPRDRIITELNIPENDVIEIQRYLGVGKNADIHLISLGNGGCKLNSGVTKQWAYSVLGFTSEETAPVKAAKTKYAAAAGEALA